jgi:hypothetical protein
VVTKKQPVDLAGLFERERYGAPWHGPYPTLEAELDAVRDRRKGMSGFAWWSSDLADGRELVRFADSVFDRGLAVVLFPGRLRVPVHGREVNAFALHLDQTWRVAAFEALADNADETRSWTDAHELHESALRGYTKAQRAAWIARARWQRADSIYMLLTRAQRARIELLDHRCLGRPSDAVDLTVFRHTRAHPVMQNAARLVPRGLTLARVIVPRRVHAELFGDLGKRARRRGVMTAQLAEATVKAINGALRGAVQLLRGKQWLPRGDDSTSEPFT